MQLDTDGAQLFPAAVDDDDLVAIGLIYEGSPTRGSPGRRLRPGELRRPLIKAADTIVASILGSRSRPVAAKFFDKNPARNWSLGWHQDRSLPVRRRIDVPGFATWTNKSGFDHCEPPFDLLARMLTLRIHIDRTGPDNAPLLVVPGSHRQRVAEQEIAATVDSLGTETCLAAPGDIWVYALPILHKSDRAVAPARRRVLQVSYSADELPGGLEWLGI
jgi:hypothetical protein